MDGQLSIFEYLESQKPKKNPPKYERLKVGDKVGRIVLGEVETATITEVEGNDIYFFYRTDKYSCFDAGSRTDIEQMELEAEEERKKYKTIEIDHFDKFFAVEYPPRICDGRALNAMVGIFKDMVFWKHDCTYQFLVPCKNVEKEYKKRIFEITHDAVSKKELVYTILENPIATKRLYWSNVGKCYSDARYVQYNP